MTDVNDFERPARRNCVPAGEAAPLFTSGQRPASSVFALAQSPSNGHGFNTESAAADRESGTTGGHRRKETARAERCMNELGDVTRKGLGWAAPPIEGDAAEITDDLRTALWSDGTLEIADGNTRLLLSPEKAKEFFAYTDLVRHTGFFGA